MSKIYTCNNEYIQISGVLYNFDTMKTGIIEGHCTFDLKRVSPYRWYYFGEHCEEWHYEGDKRSANIEKAYQEWLMDKAIEEEVLDGKN